MMKWMKRIVWIFVILVFGYFLSGEVLLKSDIRLWNFTVYDFNDGWSCLTEEGLYKPLTLPAAFQDKIIMEAVLPEPMYEDVDCMLLRGERTEVTIGGELRLSYNSDGKRLFGSETTESYIFVPIYESDAGKTIHVEMESLSGILFPVKIGNGEGICYQILRNYGPEMAMAVLTLFLGLISMLGCMTLIYFFKKRVPLIYLSYGICFTALWIIFNSVCREFIFPNITVISDMCFYMIMLIPFPMMFYVNELQKLRYQKLYLSGCLLCSVNFVVCNILWAANIASFRKTFKLTAICSLFVILLLSGTIAADVITKRIREYVYVAVGMLCAIIAASFQIILYFRHMDVFSGLFLAVGLLILLFFAVIHTIQDLSAIEQEKQRAVMASEAKGQFLANMSHEIRTPINAILGMNEMILRESTDETIKKYAMDIQTAGKGLLSIINDILDFSKIEADKLEILPNEYDVSSLIHDLTNMVKEKADKKGLRLQLEVDKNIPSALYGDDVRIKQVLLNILNNAVKYTQKGSVTFSVTGKPQEKDILLHFEVKDTGIGIKKEDMEKLFAEFERIEENRNRNIEGTGLGMNITLKLLELMDSELSVESVYGKGSTFSFDLLQGIVDEEPIGNIEERIKKLSREYDGNLTWEAPDVRVLVVDDNDINRRVFKNLLKGTRIQITEASGGADCIKFAANCPFDIIFLDHMMPEMDGIETLHRMKKLTENASRDAALIALTANAVSGAKEMYLKEGFDDYLSKPILMDKLEKLLFKYIGSERVRKKAPADKPVIKDCEEKADGTSEETAIWKERTAADILEKLSQIPALDLKKAKQYYPTEESMLEVITQFYKTISVQADELEGYYTQLADAEASDTGSSDEKKADALSLFQIRIHAMKSSAALIGAYALSDEAKALETAAKDENREKILADTPIFLENLREFEKPLSVCACLDEELPDEQKAAYDADKIGAYLDELDMAMEDFDIDAADKLMKKLKQFAYPSEMTEPIERLEICVELLDRDGASEETGKLREQMNIGKENS